MRRGRVVAFDPLEGLGTIELDGGGRVAVHATQLADGTRRVEVGAVVELEVVPWHAGALEATCVRTVGPGAPGGC